MKPKYSPKIKQVSLIILALLLFIGGFSLPVLAQEDSERETLLRQAALEAATQSDLSGPAVEVGATKIIDTWAVVNVRLAPPPDRETPGQTVYLGLGQWDGAAWTVALEGTPQFLTWLEQLPDALLSPEARLYLQPTASTAAIDPGLWLPFPVGRTWKFIHGPNGGTGRDGVDFGPFAASESTNFDPPGSRARDVTAAADGIVIDRDRHLLILRHANGWETGYYALAAASQRYSLGDVVHRGDRLGLASDEVDREAGVHVHFWVRREGVTQPIEGIKLSGWTIFNDNSYEAGSRYGTMISDHKIERVDCPTVERHRLDDQACHITHLPPVYTKILPYPKELLLKRGQIGVMSVDIIGANNLAGVTLSLTYDPDIVTVVDADPVLGDTQVQPGSIFADVPGSTIVVNEVVITGDLGRIDFEARLPAGVTFNGNGSLVEIAWQGIAPGTTTIRITEATAFDPDGFPLSATFKGGKITVLDAPHVHIVEGQVALQGHTDHSGVTVSVAETQMQTATDGTFRLETELPITVTLTAPGYLSAQASSTPLEAASGDGGDNDKSEAALNLGQVTLLGGDVTGDDVIDIFDLALIGSRLGSDDPVADLNQDGTVDILDLAMPAANYNRQGPLTTWQ